MADGQPATTSKAQAAATETALLPLHEIALLGTFERKDSVHALIRTKRGAVAHVTLGDRVERREVVAIQSGRVILSRNGRTETLEMPRG